ncbi:MAG TPA: bacterial transcriptional activator domain-containing protein [Blastocatellia bacterium]|nr:bacterial transcriptional activator domain-containing protein [Blastocatellia bacterium]
MRIDSGELPAPNSQSFVTKVDRPAYDTVGTPTRTGTDPIPGSVVTVALNDTGAFGTPIADAPTDRLVQQPPSTRQIQPVVGEVRSLNTTSRPGASSLVKAINVAAGFVVFLVAAAVVLWYLGIGRPRSRTEITPSDQKVQTNQSPSGSTASTSDVPTAASPDRTSADVNPHLNPKAITPKPSEAAPLSSSPANPVIPANPVPNEAPIPAKANSVGSTSSSDEHVKLGRDLLNSGNYDRALVEFRNASRLEPSNNDVHYLAGIAYDKLGQRGEALEEFTRCKSGTYAAVSAQHVKRLSKQLGRTR